MTTDFSRDFARLAAFGWSHHFQSQLGTGEAEGLLPARVVAVHRNGLDIAHPDFEARVPPFAAGAEAEATIGDWLLVDAETRAPRRLLNRVTLSSGRLPATSSGCNSSPPTSTHCSSSPPATRISTWRGWSDTSRWRTRPE